ncbi:prepilin-type N-terminal cleavage/methylation domain-containing protein, partial [bacterium]|nr:prepilin-type N-terminal cleavage/methylation domain-containing protein [bacterium]
MKKGFTLVELIAVISIISLLLLIGIPSYLLVSNNIK